MRALLWAIAAIVVGLALFEVTMQPTAADRTQLAIIFMVTAAVGLLATTVLPRLARRWTTIRFTVVGVAITSFLIAATGLIVAAEQMFISGHDLTLLLVVLGFAFVASVGFAVAVAGPLMWDLDRVANVADRVGDGDLTVRSGVRRGDEIGRVAGAFDAMTDALEDAADQRNLDEESRRRFFAAVGHDLRTPLASLLAAIEALEDGVAPDPARYLHSMERDVAALSALVDDLFLLSRIDSGSISIASEPVDVTELADEAIEVLRPVANRAGVTLRLEADHRTVVPGGTEAVSRALRNLIENAIRHAPPGSEVVVEVRSATGATVRVLDQGPGFDPGFVDHAFDRFTRADDARSRDTGGSGLGLAIARGFVDALGGEIWAEPGPGGKVAFHLPAG
ncbi:MAG: HAMP domain-containing sensor histidine kinase [Actinomycetota bacterium]|nr:HAMP domain-containing sensor histidine kinase [Actinomycetota bacterium]